MTSGRSFGVFGAAAAAAAICAGVYRCWPQRDAAAHFAEARRTPKAGCEQRRRVHDYNERQARVTPPADAE